MHGGILIMRITISNFWPMMRIREQEITVRKKTIKGRKVVRVF